MMTIPKRFIVVDDDRSNNLICELSLRRFSSTAEIKTFLNPDVALQFIMQDYSDPQSKTPTVLFLDINMPEMSGWDFLKAFKDLLPHVKQQFIIYMLTSSIDERDLDKADRNPLVKASLCKPLSTSVIATLFD